MRRPLRCLVVFFALACLHAPVVLAQLGGSRAGVEPQPSGVAQLPLLDRETAESYIAIDGRAEVRVWPTEIRVVLAVTSEDDTAQECQESVQATIEKLNKAWLELDIPAERIITDFISILPRYEWTLERQNGIDVGIEKKAGYRMQTNIHLAVPSEAKAYEALSAAFEHGITDIIAFDYWSSELDKIKAQARQQAVEAARGKADVLLAAVFEERPRAINVQEETTVRYPESLYHSFTSAYADEVSPALRRDLPFIRAYRPRNTYYRGLYSGADVQPRELPMNPEISVVSTVRIYFESPASGPVNENGQ